MQLEGWARDGLTDAQIAAKMGIAVSTLYDYKVKFSEFSEALKRGKAPVDIEVENALLKRAKGFEYEEVCTEIYDLPDGIKRKHIKKTKKLVAPDTAAAFIWLKNRCPDKWRDKPAETLGNDVEDLNPLVELLK